MAIRTDDFSSGTGWRAQVDTFANLPSAALNVDQIYLVEQTTGVVFINRKRSGLYLSNGADWIRLAENVSFLRTAATSGTDNRLVKSDGTDGNGAQETGIAVDDSNNVSGIADLSTSGPVVVDHNFAVDESALTILDNGVEILDIVNGGGGEVGVIEFHGKGALRGFIRGSDSLGSTMELFASSTTKSIEYDTLTVTVNVDLSVVGNILGATFTGVHDFGGATSLEIPNGAAPVVNVDGEIAVDTTVADFSHGLIKYFSGEELVVIAVPIAEITTPANGVVPTYNATTDEFELVVPSGGGANTSLSNLTATSINLSLISDTDITDDLGTALLRWRDIYSATLNTGETAADTLLLRARDVDGASFTTFITLTANNTPTCDLSTAVTIGSAQIVTPASTSTFTNKTFDANATGNSLTNVETADIASSSKTGLDATLVTGTAGTGGNISEWNGDGDLVDSTIARTAVALNTGDVYTGVHDFGGATSLEVPNSATPSVTVDGQIAVDITVADFSHGLVKYFSGEELVVIAVPIAEITTPANGVVPTYNSTSNEFELIVPAGGGDVTKVGVPVNNEIGVWTGDGTLEGDPDFTWDESDFIIREAVNDGNPQIRLGATDLEELHIQTVYDSVAQTLDFVLFQTDVASAVADKGLYRFNVDGTDILDIDDGGIDLFTGMALSVNGTDVLDATTLGGGVLNSSLTSLGTIATGTWEGTTIAVNQGGTGDTTYTNGQLLIGNTTGNTLTKAVLTEGAGIDITNSTGSITIAGETASDTNPGIVELATIAETDTGTDATRAVTPDGLAGSIHATKIIIIKVIANDTALTVADNLNNNRFVIPEELDGYNLVSAEAHVFTVSSSGLPTIQIHNFTDTADMLSTLITIDVSEKDSSTAAAARVIDAANDDVAEADELQIDVDVAGTSTLGLEVRLGFRQP